jgi:lysophospholipase L1-like esterase
MLTLVFVLGLLMAGSAAAQEPTGRFEKELTAFAAADAALPPPRGEIVFVGSSTIVDWDTARYFPGLRIVNRGLWGSSLADAVRFVERLVIPHQPRLVVLYAGDNDIDAGRTTEEVTVQFERFVRAIHARLPQTRIVYIGIKPSPQRWITIDRMRATNAMIRAVCARDDRLAFVDVDGVMLGWDERPRRELYAEDGLHLSPQGYELWSSLVRPFLTAPPPAP